MGRASRLQREGHRFDSDILHTFYLTGQKFFDILEEVVESNFLHKESKQGRTGDALALRGDEGRDKLR